MRFFKIFTLCLIVTSFITTSLWAVETQVTIRAKAHDAKFIGTSMGGVAVTIRDTLTNQLLDQGLITGGTGNTDILLTTPVSRNQQISEGGAAAFTTSLDIDEPTQIEITVAGPLVAGTVASTQSKTVWLIPGHHLDQDGIVFEFYGLVVQAQAPLPNQKVEVGETIQLKAFVTMMCGCPIEKDSLWPSDTFSVAAYIINDAGKSWQIDLPFNGKTGEFSTSWTVKDADIYRVIFSASEDHQNNHGVTYSGFSAK
ncbi:hypothetical protein HTZ97_14320 [Desulfuromonas acetoxidans]|uniref:Uncharacterized protein n=1 Tax=Desulfuromonas acetoxidans (strain DSM 684 / 11070) TaxID=281689 RepID=Q1JW91_DESA6|nr:hypothetical protein [Desulfuromonas acetoxidans]EAT14530.1 conserved hypothetical protein [Desulfuromonas acetoxidans DSM 684]MBF0645253.1 hypothetical protein [Desulfuromonas acetoxidans]NVD25559.1 hypothetical protein [Desulfuromonas acetoxidans]NVE17631.1 hypothetical protein [Desulfuromonas acetoxidans]